MTNWSNFEDTAKIFWRWSQEDKQRTEIRGW